MTQHKLEGMNDWMSLMPGCDGNGDGGIFYLLFISMGTFGYCKRTKVLRSFIFGTVYNQREAYNIYCNKQYSVNIHWFYTAQDSYCLLFHSYLIRHIFFAENVTTMALFLLGHLKVPHSCSNMRKEKISFKIYLFHNFQSINRNDHYTQR